MPWRILRPRHLRRVGALPFVARYVYCELHGHELLRQTMLLQYVLIVLLAGWSFQDLKTGRNSQILQRARQGACKVDKAQQDAAETFV